jgi:YD repeat-containing protein
MKIKFNLKALVLTTLFASFSAMSGVNLKNGNFHISYTDIVVPGGGKKLEMLRTYNSKSTDVGWFGFGWGNEYETKLVPSADGSVVIHEHGAGGKTRFTPKTPVDAEAAAKRVVEAMSKKTNLTGKAQQDLIEKLKNNAEIRHVYATNYGVKTDIAVGSKLYSNERGMQEISRTKDGYERVSSDGKKEGFGEDGKLKYIADKNGYKVEFTYANGQLASIKDSHAKQIYFSWYSNGRIKELWSAGDKKAEFKYNGDDLVYSKDLGGNVYEYTYDKNHNMTSIKYDDGTKMSMSYEPKNFFVTEVVDRNGEGTKYQYGNNPSNPKDHYWTSVTKKGFDGKPMTNKYEYEIKTKPDGARYTYRIMTEINNIKTETIYSECCGLPLKIARGKDVTNFEYNDKGLLTKKNSSRGEFVNIEYNPTNNKVAKVVNNEGWTQFEYDQKANLVKAVNNAGKAVLLVYDRNGKITKMVDHDKQTDKRRTLSFQYNSQGKPVEIVMDSIGKINVDYDNYGEIKKVESKEGHQMAMQVTQAFQNLLTIVKPAGVNLNM